MGNEGAGKTRLAFARCGPLFIGAGGYGGGLAGEFEDSDVVFLGGSRPPIPGLRPVQPDSIRLTKVRSPALEDARGNCLLGP